MHTAEPLVPEPSAFEVEMAIEKLKRQKSPSINQISAELIKAGIEQFAPILISLFILFGIRMSCLRGGMSQSLYLSILWVIKHCRNYRGISPCQIRTKFYPASSCQS